LTPNRARLGKIVTKSINQPSLNRILEFVKFGIELRKFFLIITTNLVILTTTTSSSH